MDMLQARAAQQVRAPWYIIQPASRVMGCWDIATTIALVFTALVTPFEVAFLEADGVDALFVMNRIIDLVFILDMLLQFFIMFPIASKEPGEALGPSRWEQRLRPIARRYLRSWFTIDLLSIVPSLFDILPLVEGSGFEAQEDTSRLKLARGFRTARLIKLVRLVRASRVLARWRTHITVSFARLSMISLILELAIASHWLACLLSLQTVFGDRRVDSWLGTFGWCIAIDDDVDQHGSPHAPEQCVHTSKLFLVCLHWGLGIVAGFAPDPERGPYPPLERAPEDGGGQLFTDGEVFGERAC